MTYRLLLLLTAICILPAEERWIPLDLAAYNPVQVSGGVVAIADEGPYSAAVRSDGSVAFWGDPRYTTRISRPASRIVSVSMDAERVYALTTAGTIETLWGAVPTPAISGRIVAISVSFDAALALRDDGTVVSWDPIGGYSHVVPGVDHVVSICCNGDGYAVRDDGSVLKWNDFTAPAAIPGLTNVRSISTGYDPSYIAIRNDGTVFASSSAVDTSGLTNVGAVAICRGEGTGIFRMNDGSTSIWGPAFGQMSWRPAGLGSVATLPETPSCLSVLQSDGTVMSWGPEGLGTVPAGMIHAIGVTSGYGRHMGAIQSDSSLQVWGPNDVGQTSVPGDLGAVIMACTGVDFTVALRSDHTVRAWGMNNHGQTDIPTGLVNVTSITAGTEHTLALTSDGNVIGWGHGLQSVVPGGLGTVRAITAGASHSVALRADGTVACWGDNGYGQCTPPAWLDHVVAVSAGSHHSLALRVDGSVVQWGMGAGAFSSVSAGVAVAAYNWGSAVLSSDGSVSMWNGLGSSYINPPTGLGHVSALVGHGSYAYALAERISCDVSISDATVLYDGEPHCLAASPYRNGLICNWTYDGLNTFPRAVGTYHGVATVDTWGYSGQASGDLRIVYVIQPLVEAVSYTNDQTPTWTWTGAGGGNGTFRFALDDISMGSATTSTDLAFAPGSPLSPGDHTLYVQERDAAGHWSDISAKLLVVDIASPSVELLSSLNSVPEDGTFAVSVSFSERIVSFDSTMLALSNASIQSIVAHADRHTFLVTCMAGLPGLMTISVPAGVAQDLAGNLNLASGLLTIPATVRPPAAPGAQPSEGSPGTGSNCGIGGLASLIALLCAAATFRRRAREDPA